MPAISASVQNLVRDARLSSADVVELKQKVASGEASVDDIRALGSRYADALEGGVGAALRALLSELGAASAAVEAPIANLSSQPGLLNGLVTLPAAGRNHASVTSVQRALIALASRQGEPAYMLPRYGADGDFGGETREAVKQFQQKSGLPVTGDVDMQTAQALDRALRQTNVPPIFAPGTTPAPSGGKAMTDAALQLVEKRAENYGVDDAWWNIDSRHALPANVSLGGLRGKWKCNLFAGNAMVAAGFEPPYYGNRGRGEYPNANQLYKWSDKHASSFGNAGHVRFELRGELDVANLSSADRDAAIKALLEKAEPGDMIIVDHIGADIADGGHCRVVIANKLADDGTIPCAQASHGSAMVKDERISSFTGEETIWILRPNKKRAEGPAQV